MRQPRKTLTLTSLILQRINAHYLPRSSTSFYKYFESESFDSFYKYFESDRRARIASRTGFPSSFRPPSTPLSWVIYKSYTVSLNGWSWATGDGRGSLQAIVSHVTRPCTFKYYVSKNSLLLVSFADTSRGSPFFCCIVNLNSLLITLGRLKILYQIARLWF